MNKLKNYTGNKYYNGRALWDRGAPWNCILSERSDGKSLWFVKECIIDYFKTGHRFAYVRRYDDDIKQKDVNLYFQDPNFIKWLQAGSDYTGVRCIRGEIYLMGLDDNGKEVPKELIGWPFALNVQEKYKSLHYQEAYNIIFEEFITNKLYIYNEFMAFNHLVSTLCRSGKYRAILIGNTIARDCPYLLEMGINIFATKPGKIYEAKLPKSDGSFVKCLFHYVQPGEKETFFFGRAEKNIVAGEWDVEDQPHIFFDYRKADIIYRCVYVTSLKQAFNIVVCFWKDEKYLFIYPGKYDQAIESYNDIFTDFPDFESGMFYKAEKKRQQRVLPLIRAGRMLFSDNLTGTEFKKAIKRYNPFVA